MWNGVCLQMEKSLDCHVLSFSLYFHVKLDEILKLFSPSKMNSGYVRSKFMSVEGKIECKQTLCNKSSRLENFFRRLSLFKSKKLFDMKRLVRCFSNICQSDLQKNGPKSSHNELVNILLVLLL